MKKIPASRFAVVAVFATALAYAGPTEDIASAAKKLADAPNYAWTMTTEFANSSLPSSGVTEKGGYTVVTSAVGGGTFQMVIKGEQMVMRNREGTWVTMEEMRQQFAGGGASGARVGGRGGMGMMMGAGGGAQMNFSKDVAEYAAIVKDAKSVDGAIVGTLTPEDAASRLTFGRGGRGGRGGGQPAMTAKNASGTVKFWLKDGALVKYAVNVKGGVTMPSGDEREIDLTTTTEIKDVGTTKVVVPEEAKQKLGL